MKREMMMDLDELKTAWRTLDQRMDASVALNLSVLKEVKLDKARSALGRLAWLQCAEIAFGLLAAVLLGGFLAEHIRDARFAIPALALQAVVVLTMAIDVRQLVMIGRLDYAAPVVTIQRTLTDLRVLRIRTTQWLLLLIVLLWTPLAIVAAQGLLGFDIYRGFGLGWVAANLGLGLAVIPLMIWIARRYADHFRNSRILKRLSDDIAGRSLTTAMSFLDEVAQFEKE